MICTVAGCDNKAQSFGWCQKHRDLFERRNTPEYVERKAQWVTYTGNGQGVHGTRSRYRKGCRCDLCRQAETTYRRHYRQQQRTK